jgi:CHASE2 domain-containing sensor protein
VKPIFKFLLIVGVAFTPILEGVGPFGKWEGGISTWVANWKDHEPSGVVIIGIDRYDYLHLFESTSPLPAKPLAQVIAAVEQSGATRIGVDLDTSNSAYDKLAALNAGSRLVWGQSAEYSRVSRKFYPRGRPVAGAARSLNSGLTVAAADPDGVVRRYQRSYEKVPDDAPNSRTRQFLPSIVAKVAGAPDLGDTDDILIDFRSRERRQYSATVLLGDRGAEIQKQLQGKFVLIGDVFDARDEHETPLGPRNGVQILADAVDTELKILGGSRYRAPSRWITVICIIPIALVTWALFRPHRSSWYYGRCGAALLGLIPVAAWVAYGSLINCLYFLPTVAAVSSAPVLELVKNRWGRMKTRWKRKRHSLAVRDHATETGGIDASGVDRAAK